MKVIINGEQREIPPGLTVQGLIAYLGLKTDRIAVERNHEILRRSDWAATPLQEGDVVEIVHFVGGGSQGN